MEWFHVHDQFTSFNGKLFQNHVIVLNSNPTRKVKNFSFLEGLEPSTFCSVQELFLMFRRQVFLYFHYHKVTKSKL